jgi:preprotein translocase subunit SecE
MARPTRAQRRARRAQSSGGEAAAVAAGRPAPPARRSRAKTGAQPEPAGRVDPRALPGSGAKRFVAESWAELKKVEWPRQNQLIQGVVVVLVACIVVGVYLYANDLIWKRVVQDFFLK